MIRLLCLLEVTIFDPSHMVDGMAAVCMRDMVVNRSDRFMIRKVIYHTASVKELIFDLEVLIRVASRIKQFHSTHIKGSI